MLKLPQIQHFNPNLSSYSDHSLAQPNQGVSFRLAKHKKVVSESSNPRIVNQISRPIKKENELLSSVSFASTSVILEQINSNDETASKLISESQSSGFSRPTRRRQLPNKESRIKFYSKSRLSNRNSSIKSLHNMTSTSEEILSPAFESSFEQETVSLDLDTCDASFIENDTTTAAHQLKSELNLPKIDILNRSEGFKTSSLKELRSDWAKNVKSFKKSTNLGSRQHRLQELREKEEERLRNREELIKRNKKLKNVRLWQKAIGKIMNIQKQKKLKIHMYWVNASKELMRRHFSKKAGKIGDQYKVLCSELERVMDTEWQKVQKKDFNLGNVMQGINDQHRAKLQAEIQAQMVRMKCYWVSKN